MNKIHSTIVALLLIAGNGFVLQAQPQPAAGAPPLSKEQREQMIQLIAPHLRRAEIGSRLWSVAHNGCIFLSVILSAAAALVLKLDFFRGKAYQNDVAASCAALAAVLVLIDTSGGFNRKWIANRATRASLQELKIDLAVPQDNNNPKIAEATRKLKEVLSSHNRMISGDTELPNKDASPSSDSNP
jgi:hypothetical protein